MGLNECNIVLGVGRMVGHEEHFRQPVGRTPQHHEHLLADLHWAEWQRECLRSGERYEHATRARRVDFGESDFGRKRWIDDGNLVFHQRRVMHCFWQLVGKQSHLGKRDNQRNCGNEYLYPQLHWKRRDHNAVRDRHADRRDRSRREWRSG